MDVRSLLSHPNVYRYFGVLICAPLGREKLALHYIRAHPGDRILDIGCGPADILGHLPGVEYIGIDPNPRYIVNAARRWKARGTFIAAGVDFIPSMGTDVDIVLAIGVLHHLSDVDAEQLIRSAFRVLKPGGRLITLDGAFIDDQHPVVRFVLRLDRGAFVRRPPEYEVLARRAFSVIRSHVVHDLMAPFPYTHHIMECTKPRECDDSVKHISAS